MKSTLRILPVLCALAGPAVSDPALGVWVTQPDRKKLTSLIEVRACGQALCGKILRAFDPSGREVKTKNIGKELFWGLRPTGSGTYDGGTAWVPLLNVKAAASATVKGNRMTVRGCKGKVCKDQVWTRK